MHALDPRHGTDAGYAAHRRDKEKICEPCRIAHNVALQQFRAGERIREAASSDRAEDLAWFVETGENLDGAAARLGLTTKTLERWCHRHGLAEEYRTLAARNPRDHNHRQNWKNQWGAA